MPGFVVSTDIKTSPEAVWDLLCDVKGYPEWVTVTDRMISVPEGSVGVGYEYREFGGVAPFKAEATWKITEFEPPRRMVHSGDDGSMEMRLEAELVPNGDGSTTFIQRFQFNSRPWMKPLVWVFWPLFMGRRIEGAIRETHMNARRKLEAQTATPSG